MKKFLMLVASMAMVASMAHADAKSGQKAYLKSFKTPFGMNGTKFAAEHTISEWEDLFADGAKGFIKEYGDKFPKALPVLTNPDMAEKIQEVGDFAKEYGSDSGNVPSCG
jgi:hypothetical protein